MKRVLPVEGQLNRSRIAGVAIPPFALAGDGEGKGPDGGADAYLTKADVPGEVPEPIRRLDPEG
jgi:hypothetical protein